ncbi:helix-turn-helix domain-containing protein [Saccharothrix sp. NRRL B-16314]|uniref:helix-turn-helix domain-containing protein n=1 Tax=Saccharothrix sp. NRRL B-16314 TaxID=1463825 RepID=UPI0006907D5D|nr:AraC family transcriptional regulator [Saccharothrix sp. NRRL B-16314]
MIPRFGQAQDVVQRFVLSPDETVTPHRHEHAQIVLPHTGVLAVTTTSGTWVVAAPDQAIVVPANLDHAHRAHTHSVVTTIMLAYPPMPAMAGDRPVVVGLTPLARHVLAALSEPDRLARQRSALESVLRYELRDGYQNARPLSLPTPRDRRLVALSSALVQAPDDRRSLAEHAQDLGIGERTLRRLIKAELAMSFPQWRTLMRLVASLTHLANGESVNNTAYRCGFTSPSSFITQFKEFLHVTPGAYQRQMRASTMESARESDEA